MCVAFTAAVMFEDSIVYALSVLDSNHLTLKEEQRSSVQAVYEGKDVLVWLPTSYGKSLCYQVLPFVFYHKLGLVGSKNTSSVLIISPLISLMIDQVKSLRSRNVKCSIISSSVGVENLQASESSLLSDSFLYCAPEALMMNKWRDALDNTPVSSRIV